MTFLHSNDLVHYDLKPENSKRKIVALLTSQFCLTSLSILSSLTLDYQES